MHNSARAIGGYEASNLALRQVCGAYRVECDRWWDFRGDVRTHRIGSLDLADISFSACAVIRDHRDEHYRGDQYFLVFQADGCARMRQRGAEAALSPGDCTLIDSRYPSIFETAQGFRQYSFHLPADQFHERFGRRTVPLAQTIHGDRGAGRLLSDLLSSIVRNAATLQGVELTGTTLQLLATALGLSSDVTTSCDVDGRAISAREVAHYIDAHVQHSELTPQSIADHFNVSVRQLYRIVADAGCTPAALIWKHRLERARALLAQSGPRVPIIEIALSCGFKDGAHFSRAYRRQFGHSPKVSRGFATLRESAAPALEFSPLPRA
jgi:AraC family transcriptional regulator, positive regulator of tynA and feaB